MGLGKTLAALAALLVGPAAAAGAQQAHDVTAIVGATVLPMEGPERLRDQTVLIRGDRIVQIGPRTRTKVPAGARTIDARGKVLMPGLVDMHVHLAPTPGNQGDPAQRALAVMLAHGVTTARGMAGSPQNLAVRGKIEAGELAGPRYYAAAPALHDKSAATAEQGREAVRQARAAGFDLIKSHVISEPAVWQAVADEARKVGLPTGGHVTHGVGLDRALGSGQQIEHLDGVVAEILRLVAPDISTEWGQIPPPDALHAASAVSDAQLTQLARRLAAAKSWHVPTLALFEKISDMETPTERLVSDPAMRFVPAAALQQWAAQREEFKQTGYTATDSARFVQLRRRIVRELNAAGVPLMPGSDTAQNFHIWGPGLHDELRALVAAGLTPMQALRSATVTPRDYFRSLPNGGSSLGWKPDFGTVKAGVRADLILLSADPSRDLAALRRPELVIAGGRLFDRDRLDALLEKAAADAKATSAPVPAAAMNKQVFLMRHLPALQGQGPDPDLSPEGAARAGLLPALLRSSGITAVFATPYKRTQQTAAAVAGALGLTVTTYDPRDPDALLKSVAAAPGNVLVVGHSNTVPDLVGRLGGTPPVIGEKDYGRIYRLAPGAPMTVIEVGTP